MRNIFSNIRNLTNLPPAERANHITDVMDIQEQVYLSLTGCPIPECRLDWVENIDVPGHPFYEHYRDMLDAYERLRKRLGVDNADADVEDIIFSLLRDGEIAAMKMFEYGITYQRMLDAMENS